MSDSSLSEVFDSWISSFCSFPSHEYFARVSEDFIEDDFNLTGLSSQVDHYKEALEMILDVEPDSEEEEEDDDEEEEDIELLDENNRPVIYRREKRHKGLDYDISVTDNHAELLYGLIHQRFITSRPGMQKMFEKYEKSHFGVCPRVLCYRAPVLPVGLSDTPGQETVKLFCPSCLDVYNPPNSRFHGVDGAYFGTTFGCLFLMTFPEQILPGDPPSTLPSAESAADELNDDQSRSISNGANTTAIQASPNPLPVQPAEINGVRSSSFAPGLGPKSVYEPRIYGFRVSERSKVGPRMRWLRMKPEDLNELDEAQRFQMQEDEEDDEEEELGDAEEEDEIDEDGDIQIPNHEDTFEGQKGGQRGSLTTPNEEIQQRPKAPLRRRMRRPDVSGSMTAPTPRGLDVNGVTTR